jgi:hypothetical protein
MLERMPKWLICVPLAVQWLWLALRFRSPTLPSAANPSITSGGLIGEGKQEYFSGMGPLAAAACAPYLPINSSSLISPDERRSLLAAAGLSFPLVAKPDVGMCGYGVRLIENEEALDRYIAAFPKNEILLLQKYLPEEGEAGIFYARDPQTGRAGIIGIALRYFPRIRGDGSSTVAMLISRDARARRCAGNERSECTADRSYVPAHGEIVRLATVGSTRVGGLYRDGAEFNTPQLSAAIDAIARDMPQFFCGRFDVRFDSLQNLAKGTGFTIMEINGAGSEAIHAWDPEFSLFKGLKIVFSKQRLLFEIGAAMRAKGAVPIGLGELARLFRRQQRLIAHYPLSN